MKVRIICLLMIAVSSFGEPRVVPVPWDWTDPSIPHPVYPGRKARIKAIARDCASTVYYRVDVDGDYVWDTDWLTGNRYNIEHLHFYPSSPGQTGYTRYTAIIECKETPTSESFYGSYPVMMCHDVSTVENTHEATLHQLAVMRALAVDEALWYLHKNLVRTDEGVATISGYINAPAPLVRLACSALCTMAMQSNHHMAAFPPGTYNDFSQSVPEGFLSLNDWRYENDPYARISYGCTTICFRTSSTSTSLLTTKRTTEPCRYPERMTGKDSTRKAMTQNITDVVWLCMPWLGAD